MKLYEHLLDDADVKRLVSLVNDLRAAGKNRQFQGKSTGDFSFDPSPTCFTFLNQFFYILRFIAGSFLTF